MAIIDASQIIAKVFAETCDPIVYGYGVPDGNSAKQIPHRANPLHKPPPGRDRNGNRTWARIRPADRHRHIIGEQPLFTAACANRRSKIWAHADRLADLLIMAGLDSDEAEEAAQQIIIEPRLLPRHLVIKAHRVHPVQRPQKAEKLRQQAQRLTPPARRLIEYLIGLDPGAPGIDMLPAEPDWWLTRRLIAQATGWKLTPRKWALITIDIDGNRSPEGAHAAHEIASSIVLDLLAPHDIPHIIEPSRSRTGAYIRLFVRLDDIDAGAFNASLDALCVMLRDRYGTLAQNGNAGVCSVKGKLAAWRHNPKYDRAYAEDVIDIKTYRTQADRYEWKRKHAGDLINGDPVRWEYIPRLEPLILAGAVDLITAPLHALPYDRDGGKRRVADWKWLLEQREKHAPTAARLFELLSVKPERAAKLNYHDPSIAHLSETLGVELGPNITEPAKPARRRARSIEQSPDSLPTPNITMPDWQAVYGFDSWRSYTAAARIALRQTRGNIEQAARLARQIREDAGMASGMSERDRERRLKASLQAVQYAARTCDPSRSGTGRGCTYRPNPADVEKLRQELPRLVPLYLIRFANEKRPDARLDMERLAIGLATIQDAMHDEMGEQGAVPRNLILAALANYQGRNPHVSTAAAIVEVLCEAGLISIIRRAREGRCRIFQLARHCPLIQRVVNLPHERRLMAQPRRPEPLPAPQAPLNNNNVRSVIPPIPGGFAPGMNAWGGKMPHIEPARAGPGHDPPPDGVHE